MASVSLKTRLCEACFIKLTDLGFALRSRGTTMRTSCAHCFVEGRIRPFQILVAPA